MYSNRRGLAVDVTPYLDIWRLIWTKSISEHSLKIIMKILFVSMGWILWCACFRCRTKIEEGMFFKIRFKNRKKNEIRKSALTILFVLTIRMYWCAWFECRAKIEEVLTKTLQHSPTRKTCFFFEFWILKPNGNEIRKSAFYILFVLTRRIHWCAWFRCRSKIEEEVLKKLFRDRRIDRQTDSPINFFCNVTSTVKISA